MRALRLGSLLLLAPALLSSFLRLDLTDRSYDFAVARRVASGARLYADVFVYAAPLSYYWNALLLKVLPSGLLTVSLATLAACLLMAALLAAMVRRETGGDEAAAAAYLCAALYLGVAHWPASSYSWLAVLAAAAAAASLVLRDGWGRTTESPARMALAGLFLGASICCKQTIGGLMLAAFAAWSLRWRRPTAALLAGAAAVPLACGLVMSARGELGSFLDIERASSGYARAWSSSYLSGFRLPASVLQVPNWLLEQGALLWLAGGALWCAALMARERWREPRAYFWALLCLASFAAVFPRADYLHATFSMPVCFAALVILGQRVLPPAGVRKACVLALLAFSAVTAAGAARWAAQLRRGEVSVLREEPARGMLASAETAAALEVARREVPPGAQLLVADPAACLLYDYLGKSNPTRYYYFMEGLLPAGELDALESDVRRGRWGAVIASPSFAPRVYAAAAESMELKAAFGELAVFRTRSAR